MHCLLSLFLRYIFFISGFVAAVEDATDDEIDAGDPEATATTDEDTESKVSSFAINFNGYSDEML